MEKLIKNGSFTCSIDITSIFTLKTHISSPAKLHPDERGTIEVPTKSYLICPHPTQPRYLLFKYFNVHWIWIHIQWWDNVECGGTQLRKKKKLSYFESRFTRPKCWCVFMMHANISSNHRLWNIELTKWLAHSLLFSRKFQKKNHNNRIV